MALSASLLVFDWDGTLMDSQTRIVACLRAAIAELELENRPVETLKDVIGLGLREAAQNLYPEASPAQVSALQATYREHFLAAYGSPESLFPGVQEVLELMLARGFRLAVATGKSRVGLERSLGATQLGRYFCATRCADETASKPDPTMLRELSEELAVAPEACIMIGDTEYDLEMAKRAGVPSIGAEYGVHGGDRLRRHQPLACLADIRKLPTTLDALNVSTIG